MGILPQSENASSGASANPLTEFKNHIVRRNILLPTVILFFGLSLYRHNVSLAKAEKWPRNASSGLAFVVNGRDTNNSTQHWDIGKIDAATTPEPSTMSRYGILLEKHNRKFTLKNVSKTNIKIKQGYSETPCVSAVFVQNNRVVPSPVMVRPGHVFEVILNFSPSLLSPGRSSTKWSLLNAARKEVASWQVTWEKTGLIAYSSPLLDFGRSPSGIRKSKKFRLILNRQIGGALPAGEALHIKSSSPLVAITNIVAVGENPHVKLTRERILINERFTQEKKDMVFEVTASLLSSTSRGKVTGRIYVALDEYPLYMDLMNQNLEWSAFVTGKTSGRSSKFASGTATKKR